MKELKVLARGGLLVLDIAYAQAAPTRGRRAYVGRDSMATWKLEDIPDGVPFHEHHNEFLERGDNPIPHTFYPRKDTPTIVPNESYYRKVIANGSLWPADQATAQACGIAFDPTFGGEYPTARKRGKDGEQ